MRHTHILFTALSLALLSSCGELKLGKILDLLPSSQPTATASPSPVATSTATNPTAIPTTIPTAVPSAIATPIVQTTPAPAGADVLLYLNMDEAPTGFLHKGQPVASKGITTNSDGKFAQAWHFDGKGSYMKFFQDINPNAYPRLSMTTWARYTGPNLHGPYQVISHDNSGFDRSLGIDYRGSKNLRAWSAFAGSAGVLGSSQPFIQNEWVFLAVVYDQVAKTTTLYVDGVSRTATNSVLGAGQTYLMIGSNPSFGEHFTGDLDDLRIYGRALSAAEIESLRGAS
ncbi:MAG: hypothetical protein CVV27_06920 [Candidatus Melainabacteria bacterium HGW-Melainabacteria-1]|nr:MAG: hypothetical protein CVV27_06920 [Candidatus Melainabacteria bacterium HGW-Melainabacteria-1]